MWSCSDNERSRNRFIVLLFLLVVLYIIVTVRFRQLVRGQDGIESELRMAKHFDVVSCFLKKVECQEGMSTDGKELRSCGVVIARWSNANIVEDEIIIPDSSISQTTGTTRRRNLVRSMALEKGIAVKEVN